jgi:hypothetical protein
MKPPGSRRPNLASTTPTQTPTAFNCQTGSSAHGDSNTAPRPVLG